MLEYILRAIIRGAFYSALGALGIAVVAGLPLFPMWLDHKFGAAYASGFLVFAFWTLFSVLSFLDIRKENQTTGGKEE